MERIRALPFPLSFHLGMEGEVFTSREILDETRVMCLATKNVQSVNFISNIYADWDRVIKPFLDSIDTRRLGMGCTLHDTVIRDVDGFFDKAKRIAEAGVAVYITCVALPGSIRMMEEYKRRSEEIGVAFVPNILIGRLPGDEEKSYPRDYTEGERRVLKDLWDTPHGYKLLVEACSPAGMPCSAGRHYIYVNHDGTVFPCSRIRRPMGNVLRDTLRLQDEDTICSSNRCWCGNQNQALRIVDERYTRTQNIRILIPNPSLRREDLYSGYGPRIGQAREP